MKDLFANKEDRDTAIEILKLAKGKIDDGIHEFVCWAIDDCADTDAWSQVIGRSLMDEILKRLRGVNAVSSWLYRQGIEDDLITESSMREYRLRWIDSMIEELK